MIVVIDYGMGNIGSVLNMLKKLWAKARPSSEPGVIAAAEKLILPGVGAFDNGMQNIKEKGLLEVLNEQVLVKQTPILGICLGVQLFSSRSEEGILPGLGWVEADTIRFRFAAGENNLKIPHMGWNQIKIQRENPLLTGFDDPLRFYFVHSYHLVCRHPEDVLATAHYGIDFTAAVWSGNIMGTQFHPEKSHKFGLKVLSNFARM
jgi:glutamine amidotransferase